jgi:hypothetical protein
MNRATKATFARAGLQLEDAGAVLREVAALLGFDIVNIDAAVEARHAALYPRGCPRGCEACVLRLGGTRCERCGSVKPKGQSCLCFDNGCE